MSKFKEDSAEFDFYSAFVKNMAYPIQINRMIYNDKGEAIDYHILNVNQAAEKQMGMKRKDIVGRKIKDILPNAKLEWLTRYDEAIKYGKSFSVDIYCRISKQNYCALVVPLDNKDKFGIMYQKITDCKRVKKALKESESKYRQLFDTTNDGFLRTDIRGYITEVDKGIDKMLGYSKENLIGKFWECIIDDEWLEKNHKELKRVKLKSPNRRNVKFKKRDGSSGWSKISYSLEKDELGNHIGVLVAVTDITKQKLAEEKLIKSEHKALALIDELKKADKNKNEYISLLSHELRNPLSSIMTSIEVLEKILLEDKRCIKAIEIAKRQGNQLTNLVDDLLDVTRITQNKVSLKKEIIELNQLIENAAEDYRQQFVDKKIKLEVYQSAPLYIEADPYRLTQVVSNLLHNAAKFTNENDLVTVTVSHNSDNSEAIILFQDTGSGISSDNLDNLFVPFIQVDKALDRSNGGLGLGLSIVKGMVELHGGTIEAYSEGIGKGSTFSIKLPILNGAIVKAEDCEHSKDRLNKALKILLIEDNKALAEITSELLKLLGYEVSVVYKGIDGIKKAIEERPDAIISDIGLPDMSGHEVAMEIRKIPELKRIILIAMSGYGQAEDIRLSKEAGFDQHLGKPVDIDTLVEVLEDLYIKKM